MRSVPPRHRGVVGSAVMLAARIGEIAALGTAACWTATSLSFEWAGRRIGSLVVNIVRLVIALGFYMILGLITRGTPLPVGASSTAWSWLLLSGLVGLVIGDLCLFQAFVDIGARLSMLVFSAVPPITALLGLAVLGERLVLAEVGGMALTISGIVFVLLQRKPGEVHTAAPAEHDPRPEHRLRGVLLALGGAVGQASGVILSRLGAGTTLDPFLASEIRVLAGIVGFTVLFTVTGRWRRVAAGVKNGRAMRAVVIGSFFGPFLGVSLGLLAVQHTAAGIASTIIATVPILIIIPSIVVFRERIRIQEVVGAVIAVAGVAILFH